VPLPVASEIEARLALKGKPDSPRNFVAVAHGAVIPVCPSTQIVEHSELRRTRLAIICELRLGVEAASHRKINPLTFLNQDNIMKPRHAIDAMTGPRQIRMHRRPRLRAERATL
jgi:hypothetical protein